MIDCESVSYAYRSRICFPMQSVWVIMLPGRQISGIGLHYILKYLLHIYYEHTSIYY